MKRTLEPEYFQDLNYTFGNEDSALENGVLPLGVTHVMSIAGSGSRVLPLFARSPKEVTCVDISPRQLYLTELRIESVRALEYETFLGFWSYPGGSLTPEKRKRTFEALPLSPAAREYLVSRFEGADWGSLLYEGKWEKTFAKLNRVNRLLTGSKGARIFEYAEAPEYFSYLENEFPHTSWSLTVRLLGNAAVFNRLLYKGSLPEKNVPETMHTYYMDAFRRLFAQGPARDNFFLQLLFFGEVHYREGLPIECRPETFARIKAGIGEAKINYYRGSMVEAVRSSAQSVDFLSFSDAPSYFNAQTQKTYLQEMAGNLNPEALIVMRNYLRLPEGTDENGFSDATGEFQELIDKEKVQMYYIRILRKRA